MQRSVIYQFTSEKMQ